MANNNSSKTVFLALSVNLLIGFTKSIVAFFTNSSAMFSEAVHSFIDSFNQFLLWFGIKQSNKKKSRLYPLGRGKEEYFWTLVVAVLIFTIGGLLSLEHGIEALNHPSELKNLQISISILSISIILESYVLVKAIKGLKINNTNKSIFQLLRESNDGPLIAIVVEDFAATVGLIIALVGTLLSYFFENSIFDAISSILIGLLLVISGLFLGGEMKHLIIGETSSNEVKSFLKNFINEFDGVLKVKEINVVSIGDNEYMAVVKIDYRDNMSDREIVELNKKIELEIKSTDERYSLLYLIPA